MKDILGNRVKTRDVLMEIGRGWGGDEKGEFYCLKLWQKPSSHDGSGYEYNIEGKRSKYWWASVKNSYKINFDDFPKEFKFSFYHGMSDLHTALKDGNPVDLINNSDWKEQIIKKEHVDQYEKRKNIEINSLEDIKNNIKELKLNGYIPTKLLNSVIKVGKMNKTNSDFGKFKGEIGMAYFYDLQKYKLVIDFVDNQIKIHKS